MKYNGLSEAEVQASAERYGTNRLSKQKKQSFLSRLLKNLGDPIIRILLAALGINLVFMLGSFDWFETVGIVLAISIATLVTTISEYGSEKAFEKLHAEAEAVEVRVIRRGEIRKIPLETLVVGDLVLISAGDQVPADGILLSGALTADQSALNGESREVKKFPLPGNRPVSDPDSPACLLRGVSVCSGEGIMQVLSVGDATVYGSLAKELQSEKRESPLKLRLSHLASVISKIGYVAAAVVALSYYVNALLIESGFEKILIAAKFTDLRWQSETLLHCLTLAITLIVVAVPEGLPMMITVVLSSNMKKMLKDGILVRKLVGIETAGSLNILFTDKTGTLTTGKQTVLSLIDGTGREHPLNECKNKPLGKAAKEAILCTGQWQVADGEFTAANPADRAFAKAFAISSRSQMQLRRTVPFDSSKKYSAAELTDGTVYIKGAPEKLYPHLQNAIGADGNVTAVNRSALESAAGRLARSGCRLIAIAKGNTYPGEDGKFGALTLIALAVIRDPVRADAPSALAELQQAGIGVVMVTGDAPDTATAIAGECGLLRCGRTRVITGAELAKLDDQAVKELLPSLAVVARALPSDKSRLVRVAQSMELVTGMTGDGINDAPALKIADVGFAMGSGTEIAKEAGDIVLFGDSIRYIARAVLYGRTIFASIQKFILFQLTMNFSAMGISLIGPFIGIDTPITVVQMLWINIIMDTLGALAFAGEPPTRELMREMPKRRSEPLLSREMAYRIAYCGSWTLAVCIFFLSSDVMRNVFGFYDGSILFLSAFFCLFIFLGLANCFIARTPRLNLTAHLRENRAFIAIMLTVTLIQLCMIYFGGSVFRAAPLPVGKLLAVLLLAVSVIPLELFRRFWNRLRPRQKKSAKMCNEAS
ncbi:MAG: calcium-translocating P-type ATPase, PMCA-type [Clostridia bacterium]|nr:calcium-translocating P-type ATPase, PMCA-type [Clostridia bacterium]